MSGNLEPRKEHGDNFSSRADAAFLRIYIWRAALHHWSASILEVRTAFLNAKMSLSEDEDAILAKPPVLISSLSREEIIISRRMCTVPS